MLFGGHVLVWNGLNPANPETLTCLVLVRYSICGDGNHIQSGLSHQHLTGSQPLRPFPKTLFFLDMSQFIHSFGSSSLLYCKRSPRKSSSSTMEPARVHPVVLYPVHLECYARTLMTKEVNWDDPFPKTHRPIDLYINNSTYIYMHIQLIEHGDKQIWVLINVHNIHNSAELSAHLFGSSSGWNDFLFEPGHLMSSWWFQPTWKILVNMDHFQVGVKIKHVISNHQLDVIYIVVSLRCKKKERNSTEKMVPLFDHLWLWDLTSWKSKRTSIRHTSPQTSPCFGVWYI